jgi:hypothetical protein
MNIMKENLLSGALFEIKNIFQLVQACISRINLPTQGRFRLLLI